MVWERKRAERLRRYLCSQGAGQQIGQFDRSIESEDPRSNPQHEYLVCFLFRILIRLCLNFSIVRVCAAFRIQVQTPVRCLLLCFTCMPLCEWLVQDFRKHTSREYVFLESGDELLLMKSLPNIFGSEQIKGGL